MRTRSRELRTRPEALSDADLDQVTGGFRTARPVGPHPPAPLPRGLLWPPLSPAPDPTPPRWPPLPAWPRDASDLADVPRDVK